MAAYRAPAMKRVAKEADGWFPVGIPVGALAQMFDGIKAMAQEAGRDPAALELIVRANIECSDFTEQSQGSIPARAKKESRAGSESSCVSSIPPLLR